MQETNLVRARAHKPVVIEVGGEPLGVVVPHAEGYRFLAVKLPAFVIDGALFATVEQAHLAVAAAVRGVSPEAA